MEITNFSVVGNDVVINEYPVLHYDSTITVFTVPTSYRSTGFFVGTDNDFPFCNDYSILRTVALQKDIPSYISFVQNQIIAGLTLVVQNHLDDTVRTRNYDTIVSCCSYAGSADSVFHAEGVAALAWRDDVWRDCYSLIPQVLAGTIPVPTAPELIAMLPTLTW